MPSAIFLVLALFLACLFGPTTWEWSWGPAMVALAGSLIVLALGRTPSNTRVRVPVILWALVIVTGGYLVGRALASPVRGFAVADLMLMGCCGGAFLVGAIKGRDAKFIGLLAAGIALLLLVNSVVALIQFRDPSFALLPGPRAPARPSGLFTHYNYFSNFQLGGGLFLAGLALIGTGNRKWYRYLILIAALLAVAGVPLSGSRGGTVALGVGMVALLLLLLISTPRVKGRLKPVLLLAAPILIGAMVFVSVQMLDKVQASRRTGTGVEHTLNQTNRFHYLQIALECTANHPWKGGGSQAFSWENYQYWDIDHYGWLGNDLLFVHNEFGQLLTDYGIIGLALGLVVLAALLTIGTAGTLDAPRQSRAVLIGCVAATVAMLAQSLFSFVFHISPGCILLGLFLGLLVSASRPERKSETNSPVSSILMRCAAILLAVMLLLPGVGACRALGALSGVGLRGADAPETGLERVTALDQAASHWPSPGLYLQLGRAWFERAMLESDAASRQSGFEKATRAYATAAELHPFDPQIAVNHAQALSWSGRSEAAEREFLRAEGLQHELAHGLKVRFLHGKHAYRQGWKLAQEQQFDDAAVALESATRLLAKAAETNHVVRRDAWEIGIEASKVLADVYMHLGREDDALARWQSAASIPTGRRCHYYVALELNRRAEKVWLERKPEEAMRLFIDARAAFLRTAEYPQGIEPEQAAALRKQIEDRIAFLKGAGIKPTEVR